MDTTTRPSGFDSTPLLSFVIESFFTSWRPHLKQPTELAIAIPTFNRAQLVEASVEQCLSVVDGIPIHLVVADNASSDDTRNRLVQFLPNSQLELIFGDENTQLGGQLERFANARSPYLMLLSDEDDLPSRQVLLELLVMLRNSSAGIVIGTSHRAIEATSEVDVTLLWRSLKYLSGIALKTTHLRTALSLVQQNLGNVYTSHLWAYYPHIVVAMTMWATGSEAKVFPNRLFESRRSPVPSTFNASVYASLEGRLTQVRDLVRYLIAVQENGVYVNRERMASLERWQEDRTAMLMRTFIDNNFPELSEPYKRGVQRRYARENTRAKGNRYAAAIGRVRGALSQEKTY